LKWDLLLTSGIPTVTPDPPPGEKRRFFSPISSTLIYGKRDVVLVDTFMAVDQNDVLPDWISGSAKDLTTIYVTTATAITSSGSERYSNGSPAREQSIRQVSSR
jgi:hypothetical protein